MTNVTVEIYSDRSLNQESAQCEIIEASVFGMIDGEGDITIALKGVDEEEVKAIIYLSFKDAKCLAEALSWMLATK